MLDNILSIDRLQDIGLSLEEATIYVKLLQKSYTYLQLSRETGITRSKVYLLVSQLEKRSLVTHHVDDTGSYIKANRPENLNIQLTNEEEQLKARIAATQTLIPHLVELQSTRTSRQFTIHTYEGSDGLRQMLWHELKTEGELLVLGGATIEDLAPNPRWAERQRALAIEAGYQIRELTNDLAWTMPATKHSTYKKIYSVRYVDQSILPLAHQTAVYNDTVSTYHWQDDQKIGMEVINKEYAAMMRVMFNLYWERGADMAGVL
jgi:hypothetical protein